MKKNIKDKDKAEASPEAHEEATRKVEQIVVDTDHLEALDAALIQNTVQLFANIVVDAWTEITEAEEAGKRSFSFAVGIVGRSIDAKLTGSKKFKYDDEIFIKDPAQPDLFDDGSDSEKASSTVEGEGAEKGEVVMGALPAPPLLLKSRRRPWFEVLGIKETSTWLEILSAYKRRAKKLHPDKSEGDAEKMVELNLAKEDAMKAVGVTDEGEGQ